MTSFKQSLEQTVAPLRETLAHKAEMQPWEDAVIAQVAPHLLRRLAEISAACGAPGLQGGHGEILACRRGSEGYRTVEYTAPELTITLNAANGRAHLAWRAGSARDDRRVTLETTEETIDGILLEAVTAFVNGRLAQRTAEGSV